MKKFWHKILPFVKNYYVVVTIAFIVWIVFFDSDKLIYQYKQRQVLKQLLIQKKHYTDEIEKNREISLKLSRNYAELECYAREQYQMKKPGEDIFLIIEETPSNQ